MDRPHLDLPLSRVNAAAAGRVVVSGVVERGDGRGRTIGFPTANFAISDGEPNDGVFAGWFLHEDGWRAPAAINVGRRPTFYADRGVRLVEAHLLDFDGDLYGARANLVLVKRLRDEVRFEGIDALVAQLREDVNHTRRTLGVGSAAVPRGCTTSA